MSTLVKYKNMCKGNFVLLGMLWKPGQSLPVSDEIVKSKKFQNALRVGCIEKK